MLNTVIFQPRSNSMTDINVHTRAYIEPYNGELLDRRRSSIGHGGANTHMIDALNRREFLETGRDLLSRISQSRDNLANYMKEHLHEFKRPKKEDFEKQYKQQNPHHNYDPDFLNGHFSTACEKKRFWSVDLEVDVPLERAKAEYAHYHFNLSGYCDAPSIKQPANDADTFAHYIVGEERASIALKCSFLDGNAGSNRSMARKTTVMLPAKDLLALLNTGIALNSPEFVREMRDVINLQTSRYKVSTAETARFMMKGLP